MSADGVHPNGTDTIVLIHGLWVTALSWERWIERYGARGYRVLAPHWPGMEAGVEELRRDPSAVAGLGVTEIADHYDHVIRGLDPPPVIIGHCLGGLAVQVLLARGLGAAGVAIDAAPAKGMLKRPFPALKMGFAALRNPANRRRAVALTAKQFHYAITNTLDRRDAAAVYERHHVPAPGLALYQVGFASFAPHAATRVDFERDERAPLLLIASGQDHLFPAQLTRSCFTQYRKSKAATGYKEFPMRSHYTVGAPGWEHVADYTLRWAMDNARNGT